MSPTKRVSFVALTTLLRNRFPEIADPGAPSPVET